jgi:hypothetical protein
MHEASQTNFSPQVRSQCRLLWDPARVGFNPGTRTAFQATPQAAGRTVFLDWMKEAGGLTFLNTRPPAKSSPNIT